MAFLTNAATPNSVAPTMRSFAASGRKRSCDITIDVAEIGGAAVTSLGIGVVDDDSSDNANPTGATTAPTKAANKGTRKRFRMIATSPRLQAMCQHPSAFQR